MSDTRTPRSTPIKAHLTTLLSALLAFSVPAAFAQSTVTPTVTNGEIVVPFTDPTGASHTVTIPYTITLSAPSASTTYTAAPPPPPPPPPPVDNGAPTIPGTATSVDLVNSKTPWTNTKDAGTPGTATFSNTYPTGNIFFDAAGKSVDARTFHIDYKDAGGVRFSNNFAKDTAATHFMYETVVLSPNWAKAANLELDINQVKSDGRTAILGVQCSVYSHSWEVTLNKTGNTGWHWVPTNVACNTPTWTPNVPHHIRIFGVLASNGVATYEGVEFDGKYSSFTGATGLTARAIGWSTGSVLPNFQIDGLGAAGSVTIYAEKLTITRW